MNKNILNAISFAFFAWGAFILILDSFRRLVEKGWVVDFVLGAFMLGLITTIIRVIISHIDSP